jgi:hypothetical protein
MMLLYFHLFFVLIHAVILSNAFNVNSRFRVQLGKQTRLFTGKAPYEKGLSKRSVFLKFKAAWNAATLIPGFFETGERPLVSYFILISFFGI